MQAVLMQVLVHERLPVLIPQPARSDGIKGSTSQERALEMQLTAPFCKGSAQHIGTAWKKLLPSTQGWDIAFGEAVVLNVHSLRKDQAHGSRCSANIRDADWHSSMASREKSPVSSTLQLPTNGISNWSQHVSPWLKHEPETGGHSRLPVAT